MVAPDAVAPELRRLFPETALLPRGTWAVGGAVRDVLLKLVPADLDLATIDAEAAARRFASQSSARCVDLGRDAFATFRVTTKGRIFDFSELTGGSILVDLERRDFTINALAVDLSSGELIDTTGGMSDLDDGLVRMVAERNLIDDPLRILKAIRTACTLAFTIEPSTLIACETHASLLATVAAERIRGELVRALDSGQPAMAIRLLREMRMDLVLFGEPVAAENTEAMLSRLPRGNYLVALAVLTRLLDDGAFEAVGERLRLSANERHGLGQIRRLSLASEGSDDDALRLLMYESGREIVHAAEEVVRRCGPVGGADRMARLSQRAGFFITKPLLTGAEIGALLHVVPSPAIGLAKRRLLIEQLAGRIWDRDQAVVFIVSGTVQ